MSDRLKKHIEANRQSFEVHETDFDSLWEGIDAGISSKQRRFPWRTTMRIAASVILVFILGFVALRFVNSSQRLQDGISLADISPELAEAEFYYNRLLEEKFEMIRASNNDLDPLITNEIQVLDSAYQDLKQDLQDNLDNEEVINAMIQNYRIKLQLLEQILENIESTNEEEHEESVSI